MTVRDATLWLLCAVRLGHVRWLLARQQRKGKHVRANYALYADPYPTNGEAEAHGRMARRSALELDANPYTNDPDDDTKLFNPKAWRAWRKGWRSELNLQLVAAGVRP